MKHLLKSSILSAFFLAVIANGFGYQPAIAQYARSQGHPGQYGRRSRQTASYNRSGAAATRNQRIALRRAGFGNMTPVLGPRGRNGLPPTRLDSFVKEAGGLAFKIYGDEGIRRPPIDEFKPENRIERGILGDRASGLTTGHGSELPPAWGGDEFVDSEPLTRAGGRAESRHFQARSSFGFDLSGF